MAKTPEEIQTEREEEQNKELRSLLKSTTEKKISALIDSRRIEDYRATLQAQREREQQERIAGDSRSTEDRDKKYEEDRNKLETSSSDLTHLDQKSYQDWRSAMMDIMAHCQLLVNDLTNRRQQAQSAVFESLPEKVKPLLNVRDNIVYPTFHALKDTFVGQAPPKLSKSTIGVKMGYSATEGLKLEEAFSKEGIISDADRAASHELTKTIGVGVGLWLEEQGYKRVQTPEYPEKFEHATTHKPLTEDEFKKLLNDDKNGFDAFFNNGASNLKVNARLLEDSAPSLTPRI